MATGNILSAQINVTAPGAKEAFEGVAKSSAAVNDALKQLGNQGVLNVKSVGFAIERLKQIISQTTDPKDLQKLNIALTALQNQAGKLPPVFERVHVSSLRASSSALNLSHSLGILPAESSHVAHGIESIIHAFEEMKSETGSTQAALSGLAGTIGTGLAIGLAISLLSGLFEALTDNNEALEVAKKNFEDVKDSIESMNDALESLDSALDFMREFDKLSAEAAGKKGTTLELFDLQKTKERNQLAKASIEADLTEIDRLIKKAQVDVNTATLTKEGLIPQSVIEKSSEATKQYINIFNDLVTEKGKLNKKLIDANRADTLLELQIQISGNKKRDQDYKEYLRRLKEDLDFEENLRQAAVDKLKAHFKQFGTLNNFSERLKISADIELDTFSTSFKDTSRNVADSLKSAIERLTKNNPILIKAKLNDEEAKKTFETFIKNAQTAASIVSDTLTPAFEGMFDEIKSGGDAMKGFLKGLENSVLQLISKLIQAAIYAAILNSITGGGASGFLTVFKGALGFAEGGYTGPGGKYDPAGIVHRGEFVIPAPVVSRIGVPALNNLAFGGGIRGYANGGFVTGGGSLMGGGSSHTVVFEIAGQKLRGVLNLADASLKRLT